MRFQETQSRLDRQPHTHEHADFPLLAVPPQALVDSQQQTRFDLAEDNLNDSRVRAIDRKRKL
jgi:hypothetical protein